MTRWHHSRILAPLGLAALLLSACGTDTVKPDQDVALQPGFGIAAVGFNTLDPLNDVTIASADGKGQDISVGFIDKGRSLYVFVVPAGSYCLRTFHTGFYRFWPINPRDNCFDVLAGKIAYSGDYTPRAFGKSVRTDQNYDWSEFEKRFKEQYPKLANYPIVTP